MTRKLPTTWFGYFTFFVLLQQYVYVPVVLPDSECPSNLLEALAASKPIPITVLDRRTIDNICNNISRLDRCDIYRYTYMEWHWDPTATPERGYGPPGADVATETQRSETHCSRISIPTFARWQLDSEDRLWVWGCRDKETPGCLGYELSTKKMLTLQRELLALVVDAADAETADLRRQLDQRKAERQQAEMLVRALTRVQELMAHLTAQSLGEDIEAVAERQLAWIEEFRAFVAAHTPQWDRIVDLRSYQDAIGAIAVVQQRMPGDDELTRTEGRLIERLGVSEVTALSSILHDLLTTGRIKQVLKEEAGALRESLTSLGAALPSLAELRLRHKTLIGAYSHVRHHVRDMVPRLWYTMAQRQLQYVNSLTATDMAGTYQRALNDPIVYYDVQNYIDTAIRMVTRLLDYDYSPQLALRQVRILKILLQDIEGNLEQAEITETMRKQVQREVAAGWSAYNVYGPFLEHMPDDELGMYAEMRSFEVEMSIREQNGARSEECYEAGREASAVGIEIEDELRYKEYMEKCTEQ
jgi:hypothetical protein